MEQTTTTTKTPTGWKASCTCGWEVNRIDADHKDEDAGPAARQAAGFHKKTHRIGGTK